MKKSRVEKSEVEDDEMEANKTEGSDHFEDFNSSPSVLPLRGRRAEKDRQRLERRRKKIKGPPVRPVASIR